jgi:hypothetical protein
MLVYRQRKDIFLKRYWSASSSRQLSRLTRALTNFHVIFFTIIEGRCINPAYTFLSNFIIKYRQNQVKILLHPTFCYYINRGSYLK